ncbi:MAG: PilZ domain-containing protein [Allosphingosinicella sp.]
MNLVIFPRIGLKQRFTVAGYAGRATGGHVMRAIRQKEEFTEGASGSAGPDKTGDRREGQRFVTVYRIARLNMDSDSGLCRIQNISDTGMMLVTGLAVELGDSVVIALSDSLTIAGEIAWARDARVGIRFIEEIDAAAVLKGLVAKPAGDQQRPFRLSTDTAAVAATPVGTKAVRVVDISQQGMKVGHDGSLVPGIQVTITLSNGLARRGIVRWANEHLAGLRLLEPIGFQDLESAGRL